MGSENHREEVNNLTDDGLAVSSENYRKEINNLTDEELAKTIASSILSQGTAENIDEAITRGVQAAVRMGYVIKSSGYLVKRVEEILKENKEKPEQQSE